MPHYNVVVVCMEYGIYKKSVMTDQNKVINLILTPDYFNTHLLPAPFQITAQGHGSLLEREHRISKLSASCRKLNNLPLKKLFLCDRCCNKLVEITTQTSSNFIYGIIRQDT